MDESEQVATLRRKAWLIRRNILAMIGTGKAGHLGESSSLAEIVAVLYFHAMRFDPRDVKAPERDRLILSKGHAVLAQYAALVELGVIPRDEMSKLKTVDGMLQGHPDMDRTPGIEAVTGSLGQGLSIANGMALGLRLDGIPSRIYVILGDGELSEGQVWEAAMATANYRLDQVTAILDFNRIQASGPTRETSRSPRRRKVGGLRLALHRGRARARPCRVGGRTRGGRRGEGPPLYGDRAHRQGQGVLLRRNTAAFHNGILTEDLYQQAWRDLRSGTALRGDHGHLQPAGGVRAGSGGARP